MFCLVNSIRPFFGPMRKWRNCEEPTSMVRCSSPNYRILVTSLVSTIFQRSMLSKLLSFLQSFDESITEQELYWAYSVVHSRDFGVYICHNTYEVKFVNSFRLLNCFFSFESGAPANPSDVAPCMVPFVDILNHDPEAAVKYTTDTEKNVFRFESDSIVGSEVPFCVDFCPSMVYLCRFSTTTAPNQTNHSCSLTGLSSPIIHIIPFQLMWLWCRLTMKETRTGSTISHYSKDSICASTSH